MRVRYSAAARKDLIAIKVWTKQAFGSAQAASYVRQIETAMQFIAQNPGLARSAATVSPGILKTVAGSHIAYFRKANDSLLVMRVLHGKMDSMKWL